MAHFAKVNLMSIVETVIVADQDFVDTQPGNWVQTSYNTYGNVYYTPNSNPRVPDPDQSKALRANYATIGGTYDVGNDVFYGIQPYPSWILNTSTWLWEAPVPYPNDGKVYQWDEATLSWVEVA